jgi:hypothetical protein
MPRKTLQPTRPARTHRQQVQRPKKLKISSRTLDETIPCEISDLFSWDEVNEWIDKVMQLDRNLGLELESAVNLTIGYAMEAGFIVGFRAGQNPEQYIFEQVDSD